MINFLESIARAYLERYDDLSEFCFLFPNKRSGTFFSKYLREEAIGKVFIGPAITSVAEFVSALSRKTVAPAIEQLFILYKSYLEILGVTAEEAAEKADLTFEGFRLWGEMILADFNLADQYLADPHELFKNVKDYREISTDFLTEAQKEVARDYFGESYSETAEGFWKKFNENKSELKNKFLNLWQVMSPLYDIFGENLEKRGYVSSGGVYRKAYERLLEEGEKAVGYKKVVAIGFNALSTSERSIFDELKAMDGKADFIWDATGPFLTKEESGASRFVIPNIKRFPAPDWVMDSLKESHRAELPEITIIESPSNVAQVKIAGRLLKEFAEGGGSERIKNAEVAFVLPDEGLLPVTLYSLPKEIGAINLTMGKPFRQTSLAGFVSLIRRLYSNMTLKGEERIFYNKDLRLLLAHPYSYRVFNCEEIQRLTEKLDKYHLITISLTETESILKGAGVLMRLPFKDEEAGEMFAYLFNLLKWVKVKMNEGKDREERHKLELSHIEIYEDYLRILENSLKEYEVRVSTTGVLTLTDRLLSKEKISFNGEPLHGLQVMGTLETRALDFDDVYIVSMNEGTMPRRARNRTFIPNTLRRAYGLPPSHYAEEIFAYYFYRLISRAKRVTLIYDARNTNGAKSGESRYLLQLKHFAPGNIKIENWSYLLQSEEKASPEIEKNEEIREILKMYESLEKEERKNFSSSALNDYRECQAKFFFKHVVGLDTDPTPQETIDAITTGNILHETMMDLYLPKELQKRYLKNPVTISKEYLQGLLDEDRKIKETVKRKINKLFYHLEGEEQGKEVKGSSKIIGDQIEKDVKTIIAHDLGIAPFKLLGCEIQDTIRIKLKSGREVNFRFAIDRLDLIGDSGRDVVRIVDYKTGNSKRKGESLEEIFRGSYKSGQIFQLFTYAWLLERLGLGRREEIITELYFPPLLRKGERGLANIGGKDVESYAEFREEFETRMDDMIESIFTEEKFRLSEKGEGCRFCRFKRLCRK